MRIVVLPLLCLPLCSCSTDDDSNQAPWPDAADASIAESGLEDQTQESLPDITTDIPTDTAQDRIEEPVNSDSIDDVLTDNLEPIDVDPDTSCPGLVAEPDVDPFLMRSASAGFGGVETVSSGGHQDVFLRSPGQLTRIGVRLDWGGTVVFFGLSANPASNVIDANDTGRELQIALYDPTRIRQPCAWNASCLTSSESCGNSITFLGWNPVQGGDECNRGAPVLSHGAVGDALQVVIQPLQWNPDWDRKDCTQTPCGGPGRPVDVTYQMHYRYLSEHVVEIATQVSSQETISHPVTGQEWPTLYVSHGKNGPDLPVLLKTDGQVVTIANPANDGFFFENFDSPAPWVSFQNTLRDYGVGLAMDQGTRQYQGWHGNGVTAPYFHNVRARLAFGLDAGAVVRGVSYLALGSFDTVKYELESVLSKRAPFGACEQPKSGSVHSFAKGSPIVVQGWVLDNAPGTTIRVTIDDVLVASFAAEQERPDVCRTYPAYASCPNVGFQHSISTTSLDACAHLMRIIAEDIDGNARVLAERIIREQG